MTRFVSPDLSQLGDLPTPTVSLTEAEARRLEFYKAALTAHDVDYDVEGLLSDPISIALAEGGSYVEALIDQRIVEAIEALSLAKATGSALDHIGATYYGVSRQTIVDEQGNETPEGDARFRARIALAPEAFSTAGPRGAYIFHALELDGVRDVADVASYSEEDGATYSTGVFAHDAHTIGQRPTSFNRANNDPVLAPEVLLAVLPTVGYGLADLPLLRRVYNAVTSADVRPIGDNVRVEAAEVVDYAVEMTLTFGPGADATPLVAAATEAVNAYVSQRRRVGVVAQPSIMAGVAYGASGASFVEVTSPAADVGGGPKQAPNCTSVVINSVQAEGSWQLT